MKFFICKIIFLLLLSVYRCDIPVHCQQFQIEGEWEFKATKGNSKNKVELYDMTCGHKLPSHESTSYKNEMNLKEFTEDFSVVLNKNNQAIYKKGNERKVNFIIKNLEWKMDYGI